MVKPGVQVPGKVKRRIKWHRNRLRRRTHPEHGKDHGIYKGHLRSNRRLR